MVLGVVVVVVVILFVVLVNVPSLLSTSVITSCEAVVTTGVPSVAVVVVALSEDDTDPSVYSAPLDAEVAMVEFIVVEVSTTFFNVFFLEFTCVSTVVVFSVLMILFITGWLATLLNSVSVIF